jgi:adenylate kinase
VQSQKTLDFFRGNWYNVVFLARDARMFCPFLPIRMNRNHESRDLTSVDAVTIVAYPGAGKGTVTNYLLDEYKRRETPTEYFEVGGLVRSNIKAGTDFGNTVKEYSSRGLLVPDEIIIPHIREAIAGLDPEKAWFLDGFPRSKGQIADFDHAMDEMERDAIVMHLQLNPDPKIAREIAEERMRMRGEATLKEGGKPRTDDIDPVARAKRLDEAQELDEVVAHFDKKNAVVTVDGSLSIEDVRKQIFAAFLAKKFGAKVRV